MMDYFLDLFPTFTNVCAVIGTLYLLKVTVSLVYGIGSRLFAYILAPCVGFGGVDSKRYGPWAVVTGASEGIGRGYALELARRGLNVVLMSRSREKLEKVAVEIRETHHREALVIPVDFTDGQSVYPTLYEQIKNLEIGILVNNVGLGQDPSYFLETTKRRHRFIIELNCQTMVQMTHLLLPAMVARGHGAIINISSYSSSSPFQLIGVYAATKIFVNYFSAGLAAEYGSRGILVQNVMPHLVATAMTKVDFNLLTPTGNTYARSAVSTIGVLATTYGCLPHAIVCGISQSLPKPIFDIFHFAVLSHARSKIRQLASKRK